MYVSASFYTIKGVILAGVLGKSKEAPATKQDGRFPTSHQADPVYPSARKKKEKRTDAL